MEDELELELGNDSKVEQIFLTDKFDKLCPFYMSIGMTYEQFWNDDVTIAQYYLQSFKIKEKRENEKIKWTIWEQGLYIYEAICDVSPILRAFSKATKPLPYPEKPYGIEEKQKESDKSKDNIQEELNQWRTQIFFKNWADSVKNKFKKE